MDQIYIEPEKLDTAASNMDGHITDIKSTIDEIARQIDTLCNSAFVSKASEETKAKINNFKNTKFEDFNNYAKMYSQFLRDTAERYRQTDKNTSSNLENTVQSGAEISFT